MKANISHVLLMFLIGGTAVPAAPQKTSPAPSLEQLEKMTQRFAPTPLRVDTSRLSAADKRALKKLIEAARILNDVFLRQMWSGNVAMYSRLQKDTTPLGRARLHYFWLNKGPWSDIDEYKAFLPDVPPRKLPGANFYPEKMSKQDFETWAAALPEEQQKDAKGFFSVIRWNNGAPPKPAPKGFVATAKGELTSVPYSVEYRDHLSEAAALLRDAAGLTDNASLKNFLRLRADAFLSNDYYESDLSWMDLDAPLDIPSVLTRPTTMKSLATKQGSKPM